MVLRRKRERIHLGHNCITGAGDRQWNICTSVLRHRASSMGRFATRVCLTLPYTADIIIFRSAFFYKVKSDE